jgi:hypothetical protein
MGGTAIQLCLENPGLNPNQAEVSPNVLALARLGCSVGLNELQGAERWQSPGLSA